MSRLRALVRRPSPRLGAALPSGAAVDVDRAQRQWADYVAALHDAGWDALEVEPAEDGPAGALVEDVLVVYADLAVLTRPARPDRLAETAAMAEAAVEAGYRLARVDAPAVLEGADVLKFAGTVWVGHGGHTDAAGVRGLGDLLAPYDVRLVPVPLPRGARLKDAVTALPDGTVLAYPPLLPEAGAVFDVVLPVTEPTGAQVVLLENDTLLMAASAGSTAALLRGRGWRVVTVDIGEFEKVGARITSLSVRLRD